MKDLLLQNLAWLKVKSLREITYFLSQRKKNKINDSDYKKASFRE